MADDNAEIPTKYCSTCMQDVPSANFEMHAIHCKRFLTPCPQCGESVNKRQLQEHIDENHIQVKCEACKENVEKMDLEDHKTSSCRRRNVTCNYCEITLPACDIREHQDSCGSRTEECDNCRRRILVKDLENHIASGCSQTSVKAHGKSRVEDKIPERLIGGDDLSRNAMRNTRGFGFPLHPQFATSFPYTSKNTMNPYFPPSDDYTSHNDRKDDASKFSSRDPLQAAAQRNFTPADASTGPVAKKPPSPFAKSKFTPADASTGPVERKSPSPFAKNKYETLGSQPLFNVKSRAGIRTQRRTDVSVPEARSDLKKTSISSHQRTTYGYHSSDSDVDQDYDDERRPFPDLTDETLLPCEFCDEMFPADSLGFHQATCDNVPPTPRARSPPKIKRPSRDIFASETFSHETSLYENEAADLPSNGFPFRSSIPDIGEGSAPCEFCFQSFALVDLALHQVTCSKNPNLHYSSTPEKTSRNSEIPKSNPSKSELPKSHPPIIADPVNSEPPPANLARSDTQAKSTTTINPGPNSQAREKRTLAPNFSGKVSQPSPNTSSATPPKNQSSLKDSSVGRKPVQKNSKNKRKPIPRKVPASFPQTFQEVNVLGSDDMQDDQYLKTESRNPLNDQSEFFNGRQNGVGVGFNPNFSNGGLSALRGAANDHAANIKYLHPRNPQANRTVDGSHVANPRRNLRGGQKPTRGQNATRGRSYGSTTVTIPPRRGHNPRQISGIQTSGRGVSSQPEELQVRHVTRRNFAAHMPGSGQRLGSGDSYPGINRTSRPPKNNNYD